jgi:hypothetical protein
LAQQLLWQRMKSATLSSQLLESLASQKRPRMNPRLYATLERTANPNSTIAILAPGTALPFPLSFSHATFNASSLKQFSWIWYLVVHYPIDLKKGTIHFRYRATRVLSHAVVRTTCLFGHAHACIRRARLPTRHQILLHHPMMLLLVH